MKKKFIFWAAAALILPAALFAQVSSRDTNIDEKLNAAALTGVAPPTGSQAAPAVSTGTQKFIDPYLPAAIQSGKVIFGQNDGKARVYEVKGAAVLIKKGSPVENKLKQGDILTGGDAIQTEAGSSVSITFDENYKNAVHIPENSKAIFDGIEPTNIRIINGSVFSSVDGLPQGSTWKVTTPSAVAAVRGTLYLVHYQASNGQFFAATVNVPDDGKTSAIHIEQVNGDGTATIPEGKEISLKEGETPSDALVKDLDPSVLDEILAFFKDLKDKQQNGGGNAPPTGGELTGTNKIDPAGPGVVGGGSDNLDIQDTGVIKKDEPPQTEVSDTKQTETIPPREEGCGENCR